MKWTSIFTILLLVSACSSTSKNQSETLSTIPPEIKLPSNKDEASVKIFLENTLKSGSLTEKWWARYRLAQLHETSDRQKSCHYYAELSQDPAFPLREVADLHRLQNCERISGIPFEIENLKQQKDSPWLDETRLRVMARLAEKLNDNKILAEIYIEKSKANLPRHEKVEYTQKAVDLAQKGRLQELKEYRERLYKLAPRFDPHPKFKDYLKVAYDYRRVREFNNAIKYYNAVLNSKKSHVTLRMTALKGLRKTYKLMGNKPTYLKYTEKVADLSTWMYKKNKRNRGKATILLENHLALARTYWTLGQVKNARKTLRSVSQMLGTRVTKEKIYWIYGRMAEEKGNFDQAIWWFDQALKEEFRSDAFREELLWYKAWNLRKVKKYNEANLILSELIEFAKESTSLPKYLYWQAKTYADIDDPVKANDIYKRLMDEDPIGFYGIMAHRETKVALTIPDSERKVASNSQSSTALAHFLNRQLVDWLVSVNELDLAQNYLDFVSQKLRDVNGTNDDTWVSLFGYYARSGQYLSLFVQLGRLHPDQRKSILAKHPDLIFPRPFFDHVSRSASRFGISSEFIYSIMRQESAFNPRARSHMDAFGLMQLLPKVARKSAAENNIPFNKADDLFEPHISIPLGAAHLRQLWDKYGGQLVLATASYNANDRAIRGWIKTRYRGDTLEFIEDIPYEETKGYVKLVLRNLIFYKIFNSADKTISFPEWTLNLDS